MVAAKTVLVAPNLFVEFIDKPIDGGVHIGICSLCENFFAGGMNSGFSLLLLGIFDFKNNIGGNHVIKMS